MTFLSFFHRPNTYSNALQFFVVTFLGIASANCMFGGGLIEMICLLILLLFDF